MRRAGRWVSWWVASWLGGVGLRLGLGGCVITLCEHGIDFINNNMCHVGEIHVALFLVLRVERTVVG